MDMLSVKAEFARRVAEAHRVMSMMWTEARANRQAIDESRKVIRESRDILDRPDGDANF